MTDKEKAVVMAYTGIAMLTGDKFDIFHEYVEKIMCRPVFTHEFATCAEEIKEKAKFDFLALCAEEDQERPHGEWITVCTLPIIQKCSNCKDVRKSGVEVFNFCPNCGADMRKEKGRRGRQ